MLKISKQVDYGLVFLEQLDKAKDFVSLSTIAKKTKLPQRFLARIAAILAKNRIIESCEGRKGGYRINFREIKKYSLYDYLSIFEKDLNFVSCFDNKKECIYQSICNHQDFFRKKIQNLFLMIIKNYSLLSVIRNKNAKN